VFSPLVEAKPQLDALLEVIVNHPCELSKHQAIGFAEAITSNKRHTCLAIYKAAVAKGVAGRLIDILVYIFSAPLPNSLRLQVEMLLLRLSALPDSASWMFRYKVG
jgi:hypothetical protein